MLTEGLRVKRGGSELFSLPGGHFYLQARCTTLSTSKTIPTERYRALEPQALDSEVKVGMTDSTTVANLTSPPPVATTCLCSAHFHHLYVRCLQHYTMDPLATFPLPPTALNLNEVYKEDEMQGVVRTPSPPSPKACLSSCQWLPPQLSSACELPSLSQWKSPIACQSQCS